MIRTSSGSFDSPTCQEPVGEWGNRITEVDYLSACSEVVPSREPIAVEDTTDRSTLIISLTTVLAVIVFGVTMIVILLRSKPKSE